MELYSRSDRCHTRRWLRLVVWRINKHLEDSMHQRTQQPAYSIRPEGGRYRVYDKNQHGRVSFATQAEAKAWIEQQAQPQAPVTNEVDNAAVYA